jgi:hypothetical protein
MRSFLNDRVMNGFCEWFYASDCTVLNACRFYIAEHAWKKNSVRCSDATQKGTNLLDY